jgi:hypothetical protein
MLTFLESEYGGNGHLMHEDQDEQRRLWVQQKKQQRDAMTYAKSDEGLALGSQPSPEDALIEALDRQTIAEAEAKEEARLAGVARRKKARQAKERRIEAAKRRRRLAKVSSPS